MPRLCILVILIFVSPTAVTASPPAEDPAHVARLMCRAGVILPTPQKVHYSDSLWKVQPRRVAIAMTGLQSQPAIYQTELATRLNAFFGVPGAVRIYNGRADVPKDGLVIVIGEQQAAKAEIKPPREYPGRQGYGIRCFDKGRRKFVLCVGWDRQGAHYAAQSVIQLFGKRAGEFVFRPAKVDDWPAVAWRGAKVTGIPETFKAGEPEQIAAATAWLYTAKYNAVHIAYPKMGNGHEWRQPRAEYRRIVTDSTFFARRHDMHVLQFINPFVGWPGEYSTKSKIVLSRQEDLDALEKAIRLSADIGSDGAMICMDDFCPSPQPPYVFSNDADKAAFKNVAEGAVFLAKEMARRLRRTNPGFKIVVCPPWYSGIMVNLMGDDKAQVRELGLNLPPDMPIVWTGPQVRSLTVTGEDFKTWRDTTGRAKPFYWDNTFYQRTKPPGVFIFFDEFETKYPKDLPSRIEGFHFNNGRHDEIALCGLTDLGNFLWNPAAYDAAKSRRACMEMFCGKEAVDSVLAFRKTFYELFAIVAPGEKELDKRVSRLNEEKRNELRDLAVALGVQLADVRKKCWNDRVIARMRELAEFYESAAGRAAAN